ncbi:hypothetical protein GK047_20305 [Paenibacillus sp. SYP-B3998]|uniref:Lipoprotein n=1 Tax=Paenibacillus sp. SYP-B3998 TaxID=2678564 RepID=A0A6G4A331_9BACL|nr:hypothetical protein [Paenibacillus sp. SYP-B3998]NEW08344.1 hypothetical protein [Paenibacillus sp. SYP-B3998]
MRQWIVSLILLSLIGLIGCSKPIDFNGQNQSWRVDCSLDRSANEKAFVIKYIGKESKSVENVSYSFVNSKNFKFSGKSETHSSNLKISGKSTLDTPYVEEDRFTLSIKWNDKEEEISLVKK